MIPWAIINIVELLTDSISCVVVIEDEQHEFGGNINRREDSAMVWKYAS